MRELGISLIGSAANAVKHEIIPYFDSVYGPLQAYLTAQHTEETQVPVFTLGTQCCGSGSALILVGWIRIQEDKIFDPKN